MGWTNGRRAYCSVWAKSSYLTALELGQGTAPLHTSATYSTCRALCIPEVKQIRGGYDRDKT